MTMDQSDFDAFCELLDGTCTLLSRGGYQPNASSSALFFNALRGYQFGVVRKALEAHIADPQRGRFVPMPADVIAQLEGHAADDGRPGAEEAWAIAVRAVDESETIVWTDEIATAWGACRSVMDLGDEVGARMAFREAYNRHVTDARRLQRPLRWTATLGHDPAKRRDALIVAETAGLLSAGETLRLSPPEPVSADAFTLLLETSVKRQAATQKGEPITDPAIIKARAAELKAMLIKPAHDPDVAAQRNAAIARQKAVIQELVDAHPEGAVPSIDPITVGELTDLIGAVQSWEGHVEPDHRSHLEVDEVLAETAGVQS